MIDKHSYVAGGVGNIYELRKQLDKTAELSDVLLCCMCFVFLMYILCPVSVALFGTYGLGYIWRDYLWFFGGACGILFLVLRLYEKKRKKCENESAHGETIPIWPIPWLLLAIWMIFTTIIQGFEYYSVVGTSRAHEGIITSVCYLLILWFSYELKKRITTKWWLITFNVCCMIVAIVTVYHFYFDHGNPAYALNDYIFYNSNHIGYYLVVGSSVSASTFLRLKKRYSCVFLIAFVCCEMALIIVNALGCLIALVLMLVFCPIVISLCKKMVWEKYLVLLSTFFLCYGIMSLLPHSEVIGFMFTNNIRDLGEGVAAMGKIKEAADSVGSGRMVLWKCAFHCIKERPIFGYGLAEMRRQLLSVSNGANYTVHNEFLEYATNHGIPALVFYLWGIFAVFIRGLKNREELTDTNIICLIAAFAYLVSSFFGVTKFYTTPYLFILLGFGVYQEKQSEQISE